MSVQYKKNKVYLLDTSGLTALIVEGATIPIQSCEGAMEIFLDNEKLFNSLNEKGLLSERGEV